MKKFDVVVVLGSQVCYNVVTGKYSLPAHTSMKTEAAALALRQGLTERMIFSGGYNFKVRYDGSHVLAQPDFSFETVVAAREGWASEAAAMRDVAVSAHEAPLKSIMLEELSMTTEENAIFVNAILRRTTFADVRRVGLLTMLYHMKHALPIFRTHCADLEVEPVFAEDLLSSDMERCGAIYAYYKTPKGGMQYDIGRMSDLFARGESIGAMMD